MAMSALFHQTIHEQTMYPDSVPSPFDNQESGGRRLKPESGSAGSKMSHRFFLLTVSAVVITYNLMFFNRYLPITEGWFSVYARLINEGKIPYRDFYLFLPPAYPVFLSVFTSLFGYSFIALRIAGIALMGIFSVSLFEILRRCFANWVAAFSAIAVTIYYQSGVAHITYDFIQVVSTCILLSTYCLMRFSGSSSDRNSRIIRILIWPFLAGVFCAAAGMTKQSNGGVATVFCALGAVVAGFHHSGRRAILGLLSYSAGVVAVLFTVGVWLKSVGAWDAFIRQAVLGAISAKGSLSPILFAFIGNFFGPILWSQVSFIVPYLGLSILWAVFLSRHFRPLWARDSELTDRFMPFALLALFLTAVVLPRVWPGLGAVVLKNGFSQVVNYLIPFGVLGPLVIGLIVTTSNLITRTRPNVLLVPIIAAIGLIWGNGTSAGLSEAGVFLGFALTLCAFLSHANWFTPVAIAAAAIMWLQTLVWTDAKYSRPYAWWGITESSIRDQLVQAPEPLQKGMWIGPETARVYREVSAIILRESVPGDRIFVFPHTPAFYLLCNRALMGRAVVEWFDFLPDNLAIEEANILAQHPPRLVVWLDMPEFVWSAHERLFRGGHPCGQRAIRQTFIDLIATGKLREIGQVPVSDGVTFRFARLQP